MGSWLWPLLGLAGLAADALTGALVGVWVAAAAIPAALLAVLRAPAVFQVVAFALVAAALLAVVRPRVATALAAPAVHPELLIGKLGAVLDAVDSSAASGRVVVEGVSYVARANGAGEELPVGASVRVCALELGEVVVERL